MNMQTIYGGYSQLVEDEDNTAQELKLNYLSETLADALQDMETTQKNLTAFALKNSAEAKEKFRVEALNLMICEWKNASNGIWRSALHFRQLSCKWKFRH